LKLILYILYILRINSFYILLSINCFILSDFQLIYYIYIKRRETTLNPTLIYTISRSDHSK
jgi:hypothetical protein